MVESAKDSKITIYYDGACPICSREMNFLKKRNAAGNVCFTDTSATGFDAKEEGISTDVDRVIHGKLADGTIVTGMEVFRRVYKAIGLGWIVQPTGWPILKPVFDRLYLAFANNRKRIGKFFTSSCKNNCKI